MEYLASVTRSLLDQACLLFPLWKHILCVRKTQWVLQVQWDGKEAVSPFFSKVFVLSSSASLSLSLSLSPSSSLSLSLSISLFSFLVLFHSVPLCIENAYSVLPARTVCRRGPSGCSHIPFLCWHHGRHVFLLLSVLGLCRSCASHC